MEGFIVRIVLHKVPHNLSHELYTKLHAAMEKAGFTRYLTNGNEHFQASAGGIFPRLLGGGQGGVGQGRCSGGFRR